MEFVRPADYIRQSDWQRPQHIEILEERSIQPSIPASKGRKIQRVSTSYILGYYIPEWIQRPLTDPHLFCQGNEVRENIFFHKERRSDNTIGTPFLFHLKPLQMPFKL